MNQTKDAETSEKFRGLFKVGGAAALIAVLFSITQGVINGAGVAASIPVPSTVAEWFCAASEQQALWTGCAYVL